MRALLSARCRTAADEIKRAEQYEAERIRLGQGQQRAPADTGLIEVRGNSFHADGEIFRCGRCWGR